ncbi:MAG: PAS domain-containing protein [Alistipes sp.]|nr:PAS domain-containing protein [Alistipes sp.]
MTPAHKYPYYQTWMTVVYDSTLKIVDIINPQHCMLLQLSEEDLLGKGVSDLEDILDPANKDAASIIDRNVRKAYAENRNVYFEYSTTHKDGSATYAVCYAEKGADGLLYVNVIKIDEENIFEARKGFTNYVFDVSMNNLSVGVGMRHIAPNGQKRYILFNDVAKTFFECEEVLQSPHWNQAEDDAADEKALQLRDPLKIEKVIRDPQDNIKRWVVLTKKKINSKAGGYYIITTMIDITKRRQNEILLEQQFSLLDSMYKHLPVGIAIYDKSGKLVSLNAKEMEIFGVQHKKQVVGLNLFEEPNMPQWVRERLEKGEDVEVELEYNFNLTREHYFATSRKEPKIIAFKASVVHNRVGQIDGYLLICDDVTDKRTAKSIIDLIYKNIPLGMIVYDKHGRLLSLNQQNRDIMGIDKEINLEGLNLFEEPHMTPEYCEKLRKGEDVSFEVVYRFKEISHYFPSARDDVKYLQIHISVIQSEGAIIGYLLVNHDQTQSHHREMLLERTSVQLAAVFNSMTSAIEIYDTEGVLIDCNEQALKIFGVDRKEELIKQHLSFFNNPNLAVEYTTDLRNGNEVRFELWYDFDRVHQQNYYKTSRSGKICLETKGAPMRTKEGTLIGYIFEINEITQSKIQEEKLQILHRNLELALSAGHVSAWTYDIKRKRFTVLHGTEDTNRERTEEEAHKNLHPDDQKMTQRLFEDLISGRKRRGELTFRYYDPQSADYKYYESEMNARLDREGQIQSIVGTQRDVTEKCLKQLELENSRKSLDLVMAASDILAWDYDLLTKKHRILYGSRLIRKHTGIATTTDKRNIHPEDIGRYNDLVNKLVSGEVEKGSVDVRICDDSGKYCTFEQTMSSTKNSEGKIVGLIGSMYDISSRIKHQQELEEQNAKTKLINRVCNIIQWDYDVETQKAWTYSEKALMPHAGFTLEQYLTYVHPEDQQKVKEIFALANSRTSDVLHLEIRIKPSLSSSQYLHAVLDGVAIKDTTGKILKYSGIRRDVSRWIKIDNDLKEQIKTNNLILQNITSGLIYADRDARIIWSNMDSFDTFHNISHFKELIVGNRCKLWKDRKCLSLNRTCLIHEAVRTQTIQSRVLHQGELTFTINAIPVMGTDKEVLGVLYKIEDITKQEKFNNELKDAKNEVLRSNQILNEVIDKMPSALYIKNADDNFRFVKANKIFCDYIGRSEQEVIGKTDYDIFDPVNADLHIHNDKQVIEQGGVSLYEDEIVMAGESRHWHIVKSAIQVATGQRYTIGIALDVTQTHRIAQELRQKRDETILANQILNEIVDRVPGGIYMKDVADKFRYIRANAFFCHIIQKEQREVVGNTDMELL